MRTLAHYYLRAALDGMAPSQYGTGAGHITVTKFKRGEQVSQTVLEVTPVVAQQPYSHGLHEAYHRQGKTRKGNTNARG